MRINRPYIFHTAMILSLSAIMITVFVQDFSGRPKRVAEVEALEAKLLKKSKRFKIRVAA